MGIKRSSLNLNLQNTQLTIRFTSVDFRSVSKCCQGERDKEFLWKEGCYCQFPILKTTFLVHVTLSLLCSPALRGSMFFQLYSLRVRNLVLRSVIARLTRRTRIPPLSPSNARSMSIYQFMIAVRQQDGQQLMSETGETTR
jgi:hypothetical protein